MPEPRRLLLALFFGHNPITYDVYERVGKSIIWFQNIPHRRTLRRYHLIYLALHKNDKKTLFGVLFLRRVTYSDLK